MSIRLVCCCLGGGGPREYKSPMVLGVGQPAPDFTLPSIDGESVTLSQHRGRWVVLVFLRWLG